jgi:hypothetical protein
MGRKTGTKAPELRSLQPSREAFKENVKQAHISDCHLEIGSSGTEPPAL